MLKGPGVQQGYYDNYGNWIQGNYTSAGGHWASFTAGQT